ncbi:MAG TPA: hypothetical protein VM406_13600 [Noviherbaspirillum sp.]|nr:hypothetical protein [Noviherbaspirillum sp.]
MRRRLLQLSVDAGAKEPERLADALVLLIDGALANSHVLGTQGPNLELEHAGAALIDAYLDSGAGADEQG